MRGFLIAAALLLLGAGCAPAAPVEPMPVPPPECPDVCAAICAGEAEPSLPQSCALPMCACDQPAPTQ